MGNHKLAIDDFNKAIELDEKLSEGFFRRGLSMFHSKNLILDTIITFKFKRIKCLKALSLFLKISKTKNWVNSLRLIRTTLRIHLLNLKKKLKSRVR
jgi:hypothetical protein